MEQKELLNIVAQFDVREKVKDVKPLGNGLINTTYKVTRREMLPTTYCNTSTTTFSLTLIC